jgi:hypothetical protein
MRQRGIFDFNPGVATNLPGNESHDAPSKDGSDAVLPQPSLAACPLPFESHKKFELANDVVPWRNV